MGQDWPDGERLAFVRVVEGYAQIFTVNAGDGTDLVQLTSESVHNLDPRWSPDGTYIVFTSNRAARRARGRFDQRRRQLSGRFNLYLIRPDGTGLIQLTSGTGISRGPMWGSDGWIYFTANQSGQFDIWKLRPPVGL